MGVRLQACVSHLEDWVSSVGLEAQYLRVSERLLSLVDLLATSRHTLLRVCVLHVLLAPQGMCVYMHCSLLRVGALHVLLAPSGYVYCMYCWLLQGMCIACIARSSGQVYCT